MNFETATPTFNLLSIGQRGVGKTVFLAGSYAELHTNSQVQDWQQLWFDCQDRQVQENIDNILSYIAENGKYPPPTIKATNFSFSMKRRRLWGDQTLSHFHWWDIPGEICAVHDHEFRAIASNSHACCVFIDAYALLHHKTYLRTLENIIKQVMAIASLVHLHNVQYPFIFILTKCDLLNPDCLHHQLKQALQPLIARLNAVRANYQMFYSLIPIDHTSGIATLRPTGAAAPLLSLVWELSQPYHPSWQQSLHELVAGIVRSNIQPSLELFTRSLFRWFAANKQVVIKQLFSFYLLSTVRKNLLVLALTIVAVVGFIGLASS